MCAELSSRDLGVLELGREVGLNTEELVPSGKRMPCRHEDQSLDSQYAHEKQGTAYSPRLSGLGGDRRIPGALWSASLARELQVQWQVLFG